MRPTFPDSLPSRIAGRDESAIQLRGLRRPVAGNCEYSKPSRYTSSRSTRKHRKPSDANRASTYNPTRVVVCSRPPFMSGYRQSTDCRPPPTSIMQPMNKHAMFWPKIFTRWKRGPICATSTGDARILERALTFSFAPLKITILGKESGRKAILCSTRRANPGRDGCLADLSPCVPDLRPL